MGNKGYTLSDISYDGQIIAISEYGVDNIYISTDGAANWTTKTASFTSNDMTIGYLGFPQYFASGVAYPYTPNYCYKLDSIGGSFTQITSLGTGAWQTISVSDDNKYIFVGSGKDSYPQPSNPSSRFYISSNSGTTWTQVLTGVTNANNICSAINSTGQYILVGNNYIGSVYLSIDYGVTFTSIPSLLFSTFKNVAVSASGKYMYAIAGSGTILRYSTDYGSTWNTTNYSPTVSNITNMSYNK